VARQQRDEGKENEEAAFKPPEFDEEAFIHKEMVSFRTTVVLFFWGILAAMMSWIIFTPVGGEGRGWFAGLAIMAGMGVLLKYVIPMTKTDISHWGRKEWVGTGLLYFFTWLAIFILLLNPPISDHAEPSVVLYVSPALQQAGGSVNLDLFIADNDRIKEWNFTLNGAAGTVATENDLFRRTSGHHGMRLDDLDAGSYTYTAWARDRHGHLSSISGSFEVRAQALRVDARNLTGPADRIVVAVESPTPLYAVYLETNRTCTQKISGTERTGPCRVYLRQIEDTDRYEADQTFAGWANGTQRFSVYAQEKNRFEGMTLVEGGVIVAEGPFVVDVQDASNAYVKSLPRKANPTVAPARSVPGLDVVFVVAAVAAVAVVVRRR
jgi:hypothetical protein